MLATLCMWSGGPRLGPAGTVDLPTPGGLPSGPIRHKKGISSCVGGPTAFEGLALSPGGPLWVRSPSEGSGQDLAFSIVWGFHRQAFHTSRNGFLARAFSRFLVTLGIAGILTSVHEDVWYE